MPKLLIEFFVIVFLSLALIGAGNLYADSQDPADGSVPPAVAVPVADESEAEVAEHGETEAQDGEETPMELAVVAVALFKSKNYTALVGVVLMLIIAGIRAVGGKWPKSRKGKNLLLIGMAGACVFGPGLYHYGFSMNLVLTTLGAAMAAAGAHVWAKDAGNAIKAAKKAA